MDLPPREHFRINYGNDSSCQGWRGGLGRQFDDKLYFDDEYIPLGDARYVFRISKYCINF